MTENRTRVLLERALRLFGISMFIEKIEAKSIAARLILIGKAKNKLEKSKLLKHYYYYNGRRRTFLPEFEFSPSSTPLFQRRRRAFKKRSNGSVCSLIFLCRGSNVLRVDGDEFECEIMGRDDCALGGLPFFHDINSVKELRDDQCSNFGDEDDSVDQRAEMFIHKFYEEMRIQGHENDLLQLELNSD
ncbi:hypothetical protein Syun_021813 [Stephania yunnanensis]|uniref:Uncharacterized protein n=1 Tax=Stephania yunnanensis TaxID=152371 RepID=A0AAP0NSL3_9MAGN